MDDHTAQENETFQPGTIAQMAILVAKYLKTSHRPRGSNLYQDDVLLINPTTSQYNLEISIFRDGEQIPVFSAPYHDHSAPYKADSKPHRYNPGEWTKYLAQLAERAEKARQDEELSKRKKEEANHREKFDPIDDQEIFAGRV